MLKKFLLKFRSMAGRIFELASESRTDVATCSTVKHSRVKIIIDRSPCSFGTRKLRESPEIVDSLLTTLAPKQDRHRY